MDENTAKRKDAHLDVVLGTDVRSRLGTGFAAWRFTHRALPEVDLEEVSTAATFLGKPVGAPILVGAMTGGTPRGEAINRRLATVCARHGLPIVVGSQRVALEDPSTVPTFACVRQLAPRVPVGANLGAIQLVNGYGVNHCRRAVEMVGADFLVLHLNPLQEALQPRGQTNFRGVLSAIGQVCGQVGVPVVVKEVGHGISSEVALQLREVGVAGVDVAGAGGTSWSSVEGHRGEAEDRRVAEAFAAWGVPTAEAVVQCREAIPEGLVVASGGVSSGLDVAKALALGADAAALSAALLPAADRSEEAVDAEVSLAIRELRLVLFGLGLTHPDRLRREHLVATPSFRGT